MHSTDSKEFIEDVVEASSKSFKFRDVIKESTGHEIIQLNKEYEPIIKEIERTLKLNLEKLSKIVENQYVGRPNELGNFLDAKFMDLLNKIPHFYASKPTLPSGRIQSAGYPDLVLRIKDKTLYTETKIYQDKTLHSALRSFYFKPTEKDRIKVSASCPHILIGFNVESKGQNNRSPFIVKGFKIVDLYNLRVNFKPEFNSNNPMIYLHCGSKTLSNFV